MPTLSSMPGEIKITELQKVLHKFLSSAWRQRQHTKTNIPSYGLLLVECMDELQPLIDQAITSKVNEARLDLIRIAKERSENDATYTLDAWIEDVEEYVDRIRTLKENR